MRTRWGNILHKSAQSFFRFSRLTAASFSTSSKGWKKLLDAFDQNPDQVKQWPAEKIINLLLPDKDFLPSVNPRQTHRVTKVKSILEIQNLVREASRNQTLVRAAGAMHSRDINIFADPQVDPSCTHIDLSGSLREVEFLEKKEDFAVVKVKAGCHLGKDPSDPWESWEWNSLIFKLNLSKYALPMIGGITHQTVAGFMQTGSSGGSTVYGFPDCVESIEFINGNGEQIEAKKGTDVFNAVGVSMGLMGIVTAVTLKVPKIYSVSATEEIVAEEKSWLAEPIPGQPYAFELELQKNDYVHLNWFPQEGVRRVSQWYGNRDEEFGLGKPYKNILGNIFVSGIAYGIFSIADCVRRENPINPKHLDCIAWLYRKFLPIEGKKDFRDFWNKILATENKVPVDNLVKTDFTEIWFPIEQTSNVIKSLKELYEKPQLSLGNYALEMYGSAASPFWLSPAYGRRVIRVDPMWWSHNQGRPEEFFQHFHNIFLKIDGARFHWGKYLPLRSKDFGLNYLKTNYPKMDAWLEIRDQMDPHQVFLTQYWRNLFEIPYPKNRKFYAAGALSQHMWKKAHAENISGALNDSQVTTTESAKLK